MGRLFGTDGVRGLANRDVTAELALDLSVAAAHVLADAGAFEGHRPTAVVGRDGRASGEFLEAAVVAGLASAGIDVTTVGVIPTPGVAYLTEALHADLGVMLSASHNPMPDNGIKFFSRGGHKLDDVIEDAIEQRMEEAWDRPVGANVGRIQANPVAAQMYQHHILSTVPHPLDGLTVVVDCANGAASHVAPEVYASAGANVISINASPDGLNINDNCGSTHMDALVAAVIESGADAGIAHDGDADRCLAVDANGNIIDGDHILAILAAAKSEAGTLASNTVVATVMANLGFKIAMHDAGITVVETAVGDRYVLEEMRINGFVLGGEQSGHVVMSEYSTTGDGLLTALHLLSEVARTKRPLADLAAAVTKLPQVLINVKGVDKAGVADCAPLHEAIDRHEAELAGRGRVLLRPSGTEPVIRVMVEAPSEAEALRIGQELAALVTAELSLS